MTHAMGVAARIRDEYTVVDGIIQNPGKFEGECDWVPYYWELAMDGEGEDILEGEDCEIVATRFVVDAEEEAAFGIPCGSVVEVFCDSQGFVIGTILG